MSEFVSVIAAVHQLAGVHIEDAWLPGDARQLVESRRGPVAIHRDVGELLAADAHDPLEALHWETQASRVEAEIPALWAAATRRRLQVA